MDDPHRGLRQTEDAMRRPLPEGRVSFDLPVAGLRVRIVDLPTTWRPFVEAHYEPLAEPVQEGARPDLTVRCGVGSGLAVPLPGPGRLPVIEVKETSPAVFSIRSHWQTGRIDVAAGIGEIVFTDRAEIPLRMSLENFLRVACQRLLTARGSFLMHSAGILERDRCFLLFGPSGAGKSTATALSAPRRALSDDMVALDVSGPRVEARAVPFTGAFPLRERALGSYPVAAALRLRQAPEDRLERLPPARAVATVSASVPFVHDLGLRDESLPDLVARFCGRVPTCDLYFTRSARFWDLLAQEFGA